MTGGGNRCARPARAAAAHAGVPHQRFQEAGWRPTASLSVLRARADLLARIRGFLVASGALEVDTPHRASARIPEAHIATIACDGGMLLPSPESYLKRLLAAGYGDVFQLAHVFRAEESGRHHGEEFLLCEWYRVDRDEQALMQELADLLETCGGPAASAVQQVAFSQVFEQLAGVHPLAPASVLAEAARAQGVVPDGSDPAAPAPYWRDLLMGLCVQPQLGKDGPLLVTGYPAQDSPLAMPDPADPRIARRFELFWQGVELANGCVERRDASVLDAGCTDAHFLGAMASGLPFCSGVALGVDRLLMLLCRADRLAEVQPFGNG